MGVEKLLLTFESSKDWINDALYPIRMSIILVYMGRVHCESELVIDLSCHAYI